MITTSRPKEFGRVHAAQQFAAAFDLRFEPRGCRAALAVGELDRFGAIREFRPGDSADLCDHPTVVHRGNNVGTC